ncbi:response regulator [Piscinibacter koreensis]|uniref:response regulator n=1 Tax=Piscinibacter koreensis TaxID=2742824 RepID=UPI003158C451
MFSASALRVLVLDDEVDAAKSLCHQLDASGCHAVDCQNGPAGLALAAQLEPHLVIIALDMLGMYSCDVVRHMRLQDSSSLAMVIGLAGHDSRNGLSTSPGCLFDALIAKPIHGDTMTALVREAEGKTLHLRMPIQRPTAPTALRAAFMRQTTRAGPAQSTWTADS